MAYWKSLFSCQKNLTNFLKHLQENNNATAITIRMKWETCQASLLLENNRRTRTRKEELKTLQASVLQENNTRRRSESNVRVTRASNESLKGACKCKCLCGSTSFKWSVYPLLQEHGECLGSNSTRWQQKCGDVGLHQIQETMGELESSDNYHIWQYGFFLNWLKWLLYKAICQQSLLPYHMKKKKKMVYYIVMDLLWSCSYAEVAADESCHSKLDSWTRIAWIFGASLGCKNMASANQICNTKNTKRWNLRISEELVTPLLQSDVWK